MNNFEYYNPTRIIFGKGTIAKLTDQVKPYSKILMTYGGGSIKRNGVLDQVMAALKGKEVIEFGGIQPNPLYETLMKAVEIVKREEADFLLAVGGGSVLDGTKFIAAATLFEEGDPWAILSEKAEVKAAKPLGCVLTLPATGSESNPFAVISRASTQEKLAFESELVYPRFSILDPTTTFSLPKKQVRNGIVDSFIHVVEQYATYPVNSPLQDRQAEAVLLTLIEEGPKTLENPTDYDSRANFMWCATQALNRLLDRGVPRDFATHQIGHELTAFYGIAHAESLAVVMPYLLRHQKPRKREKLLQFARRVWNIQETDEDKAIEMGIRKMEEFFHSLGMPTRLTDYGISPEEAAEKVCNRFTKLGKKVGEHGDIDGETAAEILRMSR